MFYGDVVSLIGGGVRVTERALHPIGIYDQSKCWGVWVSHFGPATQSPVHLVISPFHPVTWPFLLRLQIKLSHTKGAMRKAAHCLAKNDMNILHSQCTPTGFKHATWNVIAEATQIRQAFQEEKERLDEDEPNPRTPEGNTKGFKRARFIANAIARQMLPLARDLEHALLERNKTEEFLSSRIVEGKWELYGYQNADNIFKEPASWNPSADTPDDAPKRRQREFASWETQDPKERMESGRAQHELQWPQAVSVRWLGNLPFFALYGGGPSAPFSLRYKAETALLELDEREIFENVEFIESGVPTIGIASYDTADHYVRITPIPKHELARHIIDIEFTYTISRPTRPGGASRGLLDAICAAIQKEAVDLLCVSNQVLEGSYDHELGRLRFLGRADGAHPGKALQGTLNALKISGLSRSEQDRGTLSSDSNFRVGRVSIRPACIRRLFVSMRFGHVRQQLIGGMISDVARDQGFEAQIVQEFALRATETIVGGIRASDAFLQVLMFSESERPESASFRWLDFEYGVAVGLHLPAMRLVDVVQQDYSWWRSTITTDPDRFVMPFRTDVSDGMLRTAFAEAIARLATLVVEQPNV